MLWERCGRARSQRIMDMASAISIAINADPDAIFSLMVQAGVSEDEAGKQCMRIKIEQASQDAMRKAQP